MPPLMNTSLFLIDCKNIEYIFHIWYLVRSIMLLVHVLISKTDQIDTKNIRIVCSSIKIFLIIAMVWRKCGGFIAEESIFLHTNWTSYIELLLEHTTLIFSQGTYNFCFALKFIICPGSYTTGMVQRELRTLGIFGK